jgi:acyl-CoA dehydrogenase
LFSYNPWLSLRLTSGAVEALEAHADEALKRIYLPKLVTGEWTGTMNLTEPQAGSDLSTVRTKAVPDGDHYRITGQKIYITWGDHELTENIVHLVLARLPDAPDGVKGISLFVVPKFLVNEDGTLGEHNDVHAVSLEHKLGVNASPTCVMSFGDEDGAVGYLLGEPNKGLACMFTMMNHARLGVGIQGVAIAERALQQAVEYARDRVQGSAPGKDGRVTIIHHPDVRRMLMLMRSQTEAMRAVAYLTAAALDQSHSAPDAAERARFQTRVDLLTPVVKAWSTEVAQEVTTLGVQVHGGMGYIEETGAAQFFRDGRIITIYEGTTGIQANDLVGRKIVRDGGQAMRDLLTDIETVESALDSAGEACAGIKGALSEGRVALARATDWLLETHPNDVHAAGSAAVNLLMLMGTVVGGWQMARAALAAHAKLESNEGDAKFYQSKLITARFYAEHVLPRSGSYLAAVLAGSESIMALDDEYF